MSFQIGYSSSGAKYSTSTKERIVLYSEAESNMFVLRSQTLPSMYMTFQGSNNAQMSFGATGHSLQLLDSNMTIASFSSNASSVFGQLNTTGLNTSNISMKFDGIASTLPFFLASNTSSHTRVLSAMPNGDLNIAGNLNASRVDAKQIYTPELSVSNISSMLANKNVNVTGNLVVTGTISGTLNVDLSAGINKTLGSNILSSSLSLSNTIALSTPMMGLNYTQFDSTSLTNVIDLDIDFRRTSNSVFSAMSVDRYGRLILGSNIVNKNAGIATLYYSSNYNACNMLVLAGDSNQTVIVNNTGSVGIGTSVPYNKLTLYQDDTDITLQPMIGMYSDFSNVTPQNFIEAYSSNNPYTTLPVFYITNSGDINGVSVSTPTLNASDIYSSSIQPYSHLDSSISFNYTNLSNINTVYANTVTVSNLVAQNFQAVNNVIPGLVMDTIGLTYNNISYTDTWFSNTKTFTISPNKEDQTLSSRGVLLVRSSTSSISPNYSPGNSSIGLHVIGSSYDSIRVKSTGKPALELLGPTYRTYCSQDSTNGTFYISHNKTSDSTTEASDIAGSPFRIYPTDSIGKAVHINNLMTLYDKTVGIGFYNGTTHIYPPTSTSHSLKVRSSVQGGGLLVNVDQTTTYASKYSFVVQRMTGLLGDFIGVGIGNESPVSVLDVTGTITSTGLQVNGTISATGNISSSSDGRKKTDLVQIQNPLDKIAQLTGYTYTKINGPRDGKAKVTRESGLIAQDVLRVLPEVVDMDAQTKLYSVAYGNLAGLFVEAFKEMKDRIDVLENKLASLSISISQSQDL